MPAAAARRGLPAPGQGLQPGQQTQYEREHQRMGPIQLRSALPEGGEAVGQSERMCLHVAIYNNHDAELQGNFCGW